MPNYICLLIYFDPNAEEFSKVILNLDESIRFSGIVEKSGSYTCKRNAGRSRRTPAG
jgi:hypothetical protein